MERYCIILLLRAIVYFAFLRYPMCLLSRKRDCLHRFVVVLCERGERLELVEYPYVNLLEEVNLTYILHLLYRYLPK